MMRDTVTLNSARMGVTMNLAGGGIRALVALSQSTPSEPEGSDRFKTMNGRYVKTADGLIFNVKEPVK